MNLTRLKKKAPLLLTIVGILGVSATACMAVHDYKTKAEPVKKPEKKTEEVLYFGKCYWKTIVVGSLTISAIAGSHVLSAREIAALSGALAVVGAKYKDIQAYLREHYPDEYEQVMKHISAPKENDILVKEETYDGRTRYYEPVSQQFFFAKPEELKELECFINKSIMNDFIVTFDSYLEQIKKIDKNIKIESWANKLGWCYDSEYDDMLSYSASYSEDGLWVGLHPEMTDIEEDEVAHYIRYSIYPYEIGDSIRELYS